MQVSTIIRRGPRNAGLMARVYEIFGEEEKTNVTYVKTQGDVGCAFLPKASTIMRRMGNAWLAAETSDLLIFLNQGHTTDGGSKCSKN